MLPLGTYSYTVAVTDEGGGTPAGTLSGTFAFQETPSISLNPVKPLSYDNQTPTVSGTVTVVAPGAPAPVAYANLPVFIADRDLPGGGVSVNTNASGAYSFTFKDPEPGETFTVEVRPTPSVVAKATLPATFSVHSDPVAMTASLSATTVAYRGTVTVSGTVSYQPGSTFKPLPNGTLSIYDRAGAPRPVATVPITAGHFVSGALPPEAASMHWVLKATGPYLNTATLTLPLKVSLPTVINGFQTTLNQFWLVSYRGCLTLPAGVPAYLPGLSGLVIQYASGPGGPWRTLGAVSGRGSVLCGNGGRTFSGTFTARLNYAYYRAWYAGTADVAGTGYLPSASARVLAWKYEDRITGFSVSPRILRGNRPTLTVSGQLQYFSGQWLPYASQTVYAILRPPGSRTWYYFDFGNTSPTGRFSFTFTFPNPVNATWSAEFFGNSTHLATVAATLDIPVTSG
jgi:hypothetical protein